MMDGCQVVRTAVLGIGISAGNEWGALAQDRDELERFAMPTVS